MKVLQHQRSIYRRKVIKELSVLKVCYNKDYSVASFLKHCSEAENLIQNYTINTIDISYKISHGVHFRQSASSGLRNKDKLLCIMTN